jgi:hypothetical protein
MAQRILAPWIQGRQDPGGGGYRQASGDCKTPPETPVSLDPCRLCDAMAEFPGAGTRELP